MMISREELIDKITKSVDCILSALNSEDGLEITRAYGFMLDRDTEIEIKAIPHN